MTEKSKNLIKEEMLNLPKEVQEAINASDWEKISEEIGRKYLLDEDEINTLQLETASFLLGFVDEDSYLIDIENKVGTSKDEAEKIAEEVEQKIFTPISNAMDENIKNNLKDKTPNPEQTLNFILSGGDYSAFVQQRENQTPEEASGADNTPSVTATPPTLEEIKQKLTIKQ